MSTIKEVYAKYVAWLVDTEDPNPPLPKLRFLIMLMKKEGINDDNEDNYRFLCRLWHDYSNQIHPMATDFFMNCLDECTLYELTGNSIKLKSKTKKGAKKLKSKTKKGAKKLKSKTKKAVKKLEWTMLK